MATLLCYTKPGIGLYTNENYPGHAAVLADWEHAMHLAISENDGAFVPLRNNTGILFPRCTFSEGKPQGTTKTLIDPWIFRTACRQFGVVCIRRNQNAPDPLTIGSIMLFLSRDLVRYEEAGFIKVAEEEIRHPKCRFDREAGYYRLEWETSNGVFTGQTVSLREVSGIASCGVSGFPQPDSMGLNGILPGNTLEITEDEAAVLKRYFGVIENCGVKAPSVKVKERIPFDRLPRVTCLYTDGSTHDKPVSWNREEYDRIDFARPGVYHISGTIRQKTWPFPMPLSKGQFLLDNGWGRGMSDPCLTCYRGKYYLTCSGTDHIIIRCATRPEDTFSAPPIEIKHVTAPGCKTCQTWAAELHEINGKLYMLTAICPDGIWTKVQSVVIPCCGDPCNPAGWDDAHACLKPNGEPLTVGGISLDMTYFCVRGVHYVMWSNRLIRQHQAPTIAEPANLYIATVHPDAPWQLTTEPTCILRPVYGWDRFETEVDEGPYLLRHHDDLFVTVSGSSTGMTDLYDVGILHAKEGSNLLLPQSWDWVPYPLLTKESVPNQLGPGHNSFVTDPETEDTLFVFHAVPQDANGKHLGRQPGIRRVHWAKSGYPYLEMTGERDLKDPYRHVTMTVTVL